VIVTAGLTPAWQQILQFPTLTWGEVNRAAAAHWCASGKVLNVGVALAHLKSESQTLAPLGGWPRPAMERELASLGVRGTWLPTEHPTRVCTTLLDQTRSQTTELVQNAGALSTAELAAFRAEFARLAANARVVVLTGSLSAAAPADFYAQLIASTSANVVLDARGPELWQALPARPYLIKPNRSELASTLARGLETHAELLQGMRELLQAGAQHVLVTDGPRSAYLAERDGWWELPLCPVAAYVNPIASGDCLAAGVAWGLDQGHDMVASVRLGLAAAALNVEQLLPARLDPQTVRVRATSIANGSQQPWD